MEWIDQKFFKNAYHQTFELKQLIVYTQDLNIFSVIVNPIVSLQYTKDQFGWKAQRSGFFKK